MSKPNHTPEKSSTKVDYQPRLTNFRDGEPDLVILLAAAYRAVTERLLEDMRKAGIAGMRPAYGYVIRAVAAEEPTLNRLAELLDITKQAASKLAQQMVRGGFLVQAVDPQDRRQIRLRLGAKGRRVREQALATSATVERELRRAAGGAAVDGLRQALLDLLARQGGLEDVLARRARPVW
jgi:DNA-binding MarR family transcriptional regulator